MIQGFRGIEGNNFYYLQFLEILLSITTTVAHQFFPRTGSNFIVLKVRRESHTGFLLYILFKFCKDFEEMMVNIYVLLQFLEIHVVFKKKL